MARAAADDEEQGPAIGIPTLDQRCEIAGILGSPNDRRRFE